MVTGKFRAVDASAPLAFLGFSREKLRPLLTFQPSMALAAMFPLLTF